MSESIPLIWSNDDITYGQSEPLRRQLDLLDRRGIPGTFFLIPRKRAAGAGTGAAAGRDEAGRTLADDAELLRTIERARGRGHEFFQHGHVHTPFESGVPPTWMLDFSPEVRRRYDEQRLEIEKAHTLEALVEMIESGRRIWRRAFGEDSEGYRPGWGAFCGNLYRALEVLGVKWVSSRLPLRTSWLWNQGLWDEPAELRDDAPVGPYRFGKLVEIPVGGDYGFRVPHEPDRIDAMVQLGLREFEHCRRHGWPMIMVSHWHGLEANDASGYAVHEKLLPAILATGKAQPMGMTRVFREFVEKEKRGK